ncbi:MAG TPA: class I SAM-dependent methyltransferase [Flavobacterium sp.]|nr:class I SAM-dependent methyltransferase [Flavobacterium sp.]
METDLSGNIDNGFASLYAEYETLSRENFIDIARRNTIRKHVESYLKPNDKILEINAGSGIDAVYFAQKGHPVLATDISEGAENEIENKIKSSGLENLRFQQCSFTALETIGNEKFDHVFSNFGGLNCTSDLVIVFKELDRLLHREGYASLVVMPPYYPWEMLAFLKGNKAAFRRFGNGVANVGTQTIPVFYFTPRQVKSAFPNNFRHIKTRNIGTFYPSAHFSSFEKHQNTISKLIRFDDWINDSVLMPKGIGDYFIITFQKIN